MYIILYIILLQLWEEPIRLNYIKDPFRDY
jgi:hypothetical protein